jgi:hypothetical protein
MEREDEPNVVIRRDSNNHVGQAECWIFSTGSAGYNILRSFWFHDQFFSHLGPQDLMGIP